MPSEVRQVHRQVRAAKNQALFREVNERVEQLNQGLGIMAPLAEFVCECADETCTEQLSMTVQEYEAVRQDGATFAVLPDHVFVDVERVVEKHEQYWVVEKFEEAGRAATRLDPRTRRRIRDG